MRSANSIGMVHQELSVVPDLTVAENVFLGNQPLTAIGTVDWGRMNRDAKRLIASLGLDIDPTTTMGSLPVGLQQLVELSRVLFSGAQIIILDEPTSALSPPEVKQLFEVLRRLRAEGRSIVFISHFLDDVLAISDRVTVFRNGHKVITEDTKNLTKDLVIAHMIGRGSKGMHMGEEAELKGDDAKPVVLSVRGRERRPATCVISRSNSAPARSPASTASWAAGRSSWRARCSARSRCGAAPEARRQAGALPVHRGGARRGHRLRAGEPAHDAVPAGAGLQEHLDRHPRPHSPPAG